MKKIIFALALSALLYSCKKHMVEPVPVLENVPYESHPKKAVSNTSNGYGIIYTISNFSYTSDGSLRSIISYDSLYPALKDSILYEYVNGKVSRKIHTGNTDERFNYNTQGKIETYVDKSISAEKTWRYYYDANGKVSHVLSFTPGGEMIDSIAVDGIHTIMYIDKIGGDPNGYWELQGFAYMTRQDYFIADYGIFAVPYTTAFAGIQKKIPFQEEIAQYLFQDEQPVYPYYGIYQIAQPRNLCATTPNGYTGTYFFDSHNRMSSAMVFHPAFTQTGSPIPNGTEIKLYY